MMKSGQKIWIQLPTTMAAARVEPAAATAQSLQDQAAHLERTVGAFKANKNTS